MSNQNVLLGFYHEWPYLSHHAHSLDPVKLCASPSLTHKMKNQKKNSLNNLTEQGSSIILPSLLPSGLLESVSSAHRVKAGNTHPGQIATLAPRSNEESSFDLNMHVTCRENLHTH